MEQAKKANYFLIGAAALAALTMAFMVMRNRERDDLPLEDAQGAPAPAATAPAGERVLPKDVRFKVPVSNLQPFEGPADALVTMVEWCDMRHKACREGDKVLDQLMKEYEGRLRRVYRVVPNGSREEESKAVNQLAQAAYEESGKDSKKYLEVRKQIMALPDGAPIGENELRPIAKSVGLNYDKIAPKISDGFYLTAYGLDGGFGLRFGVKQLPGVFVNGRPAQIGNLGQDLKKSVKALIDEELVHAQKVLDKGGVEKPALYDKIVDDGLWSLDDDPAHRQASAAPPTASSLTSDLEVGESAARKQ